MELRTILLDKKKSDDEDGTDVVKIQRNREGCPVRNLKPEQLSAKRGCEGSS